MPAPSSSLAELEAIEQLVADARIELTKQSIQTPAVRRALAKLNQVRVRLLSLNVALAHALPRCPAYPDCREIGECSCARERIAR